MNKVAKRTLMTVTAIGAVIVLGLGATTVTHAVATQVESGRIDAYGQTVTVGGRDMNVLVAGDGADTVVLLPGFGTASPVLDFAPLIDGLSEEHRVIAVEPFGYGLSDQTDRPRTTRNIVAEVHDALQALGVERYTLMGHSIAGIHALEFAERYPDELVAFVGIDSSVPDQPGMDAALPTGLLTAAKDLGLMRLAAALGGSGYDAPAYSAHDQEQLSLLTNRNSLNPTYVDEMSRIGENFRHAAGRTFPRDLPVLLFVVSENPHNPDWLRLHEDQAASVDDGTVIPLDGDHYLHHTRSLEILEEFARWTTDRNAAG